MHACTQRELLAMLGAVGTSCRSGVSMCPMLAMSLLSPFRVRFFGLFAILSMLGESSPSQHTRDSVR